MGRRYFNDGQEIILEDLNAISSALERQMYERLAYFMNGETDDAFFGDSFKAVYSSANSVIVTAGLGLQRDNTQTSPEPKVRPLFVSTNATKTIDAPHASLPRVDIVVVKNRLVDEITATRNFKDAGTSEITQESFTVQKDWDAEILVVAGTPNAMPVAPSVPSGYLKIATLAVAAVSGMAGAGDVTDDRATMPVGALATLNTVGFERLTAGASVSIETLFADIDAFLKNGDFQYFDLEDLEADPSAPVAADYHRVYMKDGVLYKRSTGGSATPLGGGGGGGGSLQWYGKAGAAPPRTEEFSQDVSLLGLADGNKEVAYVKVPESFIVGRQVTALLGFYSLSASNEWQIRVTTTLIRDNQDAIDSTTNQNTYDTADVVNASAKRYRKVNVELSSATGTINSVAISPGDVLRVEVERVAIDGGVDDADDVRFVRGAAEVKFA